MAYDNSNRVSLWLNAKRETQTHPHLTGKGETSEPVWASAWFDKDLDPTDAKALMGIIKRHAANTNRPLITVSLKPQEQRETRSAGAGAAPEFDDDLDIPF